MKIMLTGRRGRGKDSMADILQKHVPELTRAAFAAELKDDVDHMLREQIAWTDYEWDERADQLLANRNLLGPIWQGYGELMRNFDPDHWVNAFAVRYGHIPDLVVTDLRHHNEAEYGMKNGFLLVRLAGPNYRPDAASDQRSDNHPSEIHVPDLNVHLEYDNNIPGLEAMEEWVTGLLIPVARLHEHAEALRA